MLPGGAHELKQLTEENSKPKRIVADLTPGQGHGSMTSFKKRVVKPVKQREVVTYLMRPLPGQSASRRDGRALPSLESAVPEPARSAHAPAPAPARAGADPRGASAIDASWYCCNPKAGTSASSASTGCRPRRGLVRRKRPWRHATAVHREQRRPSTTE